MKRALCTVMVMLLMFGAMPVCGNASEYHTETIYFEDGSYLVVEMLPSCARVTGSLTGSKPSTFYNSDGEAQWKVTLTGSFTYTGTTSACSSSSVSVTIYDSSWYVVSKSSGKSGNTATASVTMGRKPLGVTVQKVPVSLSLSCDASGNLS